MGEVVLVVMAQVVEHLPSKFKELSLNPSTTKKILPKPKTTPPKSHHHKKLKYLPFNCPFMTL
jgi:hypothetical protein